MAGSKGDYFEFAVLNILGGSNITAPSNVYLHLYTTGTLTEAGTGAQEVTGNGYAPAQIVNNTTNFPAASGEPARKTNGTTIMFDIATTDWGTITQWAIKDNTNNTFYYGTFDTAKPINANDTVVIPAGSLNIYEL